MEQWESRRIRNESLEIRLLFYFHFSCVLQLRTDEEFPSFYQFILVSRHGSDSNNMIVLIYYSVGVCHIYIVYYYTRD